MQYTCPTYYKTISETGLRYLRDCEEVRHTLLQVRESEGQCIAEFPCGTFILPLEMEAELHGAVGKKIGVIRIGSDYRARALE